MNEPMTTEQKRTSIIEEMQSLGDLVVAYSGGVDSSLVAALAFEALGDRALAVTAVSETLGGRELQDARRVAREIGIRHELVEFSELDDERFVENTASRCFFCQSMRFDQLGKLAAELGCDVLASGTNADDTGDHRPGLAAMSERNVYQPLLEWGVSKDEVRRMARAIGLSVWDKPAKACLSSRIPHGLSVTHDRLRRIERAEDAIEDLGYRQFRVRDHRGTARVEVGVDELDRLLAEVEEIAARLRRAGFDRVTVDLHGYESGSLNPRTTGDR